MSQTQTVATALPAQERLLVSTSAETASIPWNVWLILGCIGSGIIGGTWDLSWHMSIGRETFWTMPHILIQAGAVVGGFASFSAILRATFSRDLLVRQAAIRVLGFYGPAGAFIAAWGSIAMVASAPFDNWWHNAYGLDSQIGTPPHMLLSLGFFATQIGVMAWMAGIMNRSDKALQHRLAWLLLLVGSASVTLFALLVLELTLKFMMHSAACYLALAIAIPSAMIASGRGSANKWGCTVTAAVYMGIGVAGEWLLPLFPAQPKLGPVYHNVTHLIPMPFPLLLIVPAFVVDLLLQRLEGRSSWAKALCVGPAFVLSFLAVQWPFADFLMSPASRSWVFGTAYFPYFEPAGLLYDPYKFAVVEKTTGAFLLTMTAALFFSILTSRLGLGWGDWMRRARR